MRDGCRPALLLRHIASRVGRRTLEIGTHILLTIAELFGKRIEKKRAQPLVRGIAMESGVPIQVDLNLRQPDRVGHIPQAEKGSSPFREFLGHRRDQVCRVPDAGNDDESRNTQVNRMARLNASVASGICLFESRRRRLLPVLDSP